MKSFLTATQIAKLEELTPTTVARWVREGRFEDVRKVGRVYRIPMESYRRWRETTKLTTERSFERTDERTTVRIYP